MHGDMGHAWEHVGLAWGEAVRVLRVAQCMCRWGRAHSRPSMTARGRTSVGSKRNRRERDSSPIDPQGPIPLEANLSLLDMSCTHAHTHALVGSIDCMLGLCALRLLPWIGLRALAHVQLHVQHWAARFSGGGVLHLSAAGSADNYEQCWAGYKSAVVMSTECLDAMQTMTMKRRKRSPLRQSQKSESVRVSPPYLQTKLQRLESAPGRVPSVREAELTRAVMKRI
jgi:hypothetical protein